MKGIAILSLSSVLMFGLTNVASAQTVESSKVISQKNEIKDLKVLLERAKKGESDLKTEQVKSSSDLVNAETKVHNKVSIYKTTQHIKSEKLQDGTIKNSYVTTSFAEPESTSSKTNSGYDVSVGVKAYSTIYWTESSVWNGTTYEKYYDLDNASGGWTVEDPYLIVSPQKVTLGQTGWSKFAAGSTTQSTVFYPSSLSWNYVAPASWYAVQAASGPSVGETQVANVSDSGTSWSFSFTNNI